MRSSAAVDALGAYILFAVDFPLLVELRGRRSSGRRSPGGFVAEVTRPRLSSAPYDSGEPLATPRTEEGPYRASRPSPVQSISTVFRRSQGRRRK